MGTVALIMASASVGATLGVVFLGAVTNNEDEREEARRYRLGLRAHRPEDPDFRDFSG